MTEALQLAPQEHLDEIAGRGHELVATQLQGKIANLAIKSTEQTSVYTLERTSAWEADQPIVKDVLQDVTSATNAAHKALHEQDAIAGTNNAADHEKVWSEATGLLRTFAEESITQHRQDVAAGVGTLEGEARATRATQSFLAISIIGHGAESKRYYGGDETSAQADLQTFMRDGFAVETMEGAKELHDHGVIGIKYVESDSFDKVAKAVPITELVTPSIVASTELATGKRFDFEAPTEVFGVTDLSAAEKETLAVSEAVYGAYDIAINSGHEKSEVTELGAAVCDRALSAGYDAKGGYHEDSFETRLDSMRLVSKHDPDLLTGSNWDATARAVKIDRKVQSNYRGNVSGQIQRDGLIVGMANSGDQRLVDAAIDLVSDRPTDEAGNLAHAARFIGVSQEGATNVLLAASHFKAHESEVVRDEMVSNASAKSNLAVSYVNSLWENAPDRGEAINAAQTIAGVIESMDEGSTTRRALEGVLGRAFDGSSDKFQLAESFTELGTAEGRLTELIDQIKTLEAIALPPEFAVQAGGQIELSHLEKIDLLTEKLSMLAADQDIVESLRTGMYKDESANFAKNYLSAQSAEDFVDRIKGVLNDEDLQIIIMPGSHLEFLASRVPTMSLEDKPWRDDDVLQVMKQLAASDFIRGALGDESIRAKLQTGILGHEADWARIMEGLGSEPDVAAANYVLHHIAKDKLESPLVSASLFTGMKLPQYISDAAFSNAGIALLRSVAERASTDKLPVKETRLREFMKDPAILTAYKELIGLKNESGSQTDLESLLTAALERGSISDELAEQIRGAEYDADIDSTVGIAQLKQMASDRKSFDEGRPKWLAQYSKQDIRTSHLLLAWKSRLPALKQGVADSPSAIVEWAKDNAFRLHVEQLRKQGTPEQIAELPTDQQLQKYSALISDLSGKYDSEKTMSSFKRYIKAEAEGKLSNSEFDAGSVQITDAAGSEFTVEIFDKADTRGFTIGVDTGCCMTIGGASESCIWAGYEDPRYAFMGVYKDGRLRAQSLLYIGEQEGDLEKSKVLVLDNIEANAGTDLSNLVGVYQDGLRKLIEQGVVKPPVTQVNLGTGYVDLDIAGLPKTRSVATPLEETYTDAKNQRLMLNLTSAA